MKRVEFVLTMPNIGSWNGDWSGEEKHFAVVEHIKDAKVKELFGDRPERSWRHHWDDGWSACVSARLMKKGERTKKSDGFCGYEWMAKSILKIGKIRYSREFT
jgi:hypothetical protein